MPYFINIK